MADLLQRAAMGMGINGFKVAQINPGEVCVLTTSLGLAVACSISMSARFKDTDLARFISANY